MGLGFATNAVTVNSQTAYRKGEYFRQQLTVNNSEHARLAVRDRRGHRPEQRDRQRLRAQELRSNSTYDADGNLTNDGRWTYTWDAENRLVEPDPQHRGWPAAFASSSSMTGKGRRIHKQVWPNTSWSGTPTNDVKFVYDGWNLIADLNAQTTLSSVRIIWGSDLSGTMQGAGGVGGLLEVATMVTRRRNCFRRL